MTTAPGAGDAITVDAGRVDVLHRLALAVRPIDARTTGTAGGVRIGREAPAPGGPVRLLESHGAAGWVLRYGSGTGGVRSRVVVLRLDDPDRRFVPRRFRLPLWTLAELTGADGRPPTAAYVPAASRLLRPWLLPGVAYPVTGGVTGLRLRVTHRGAPVRWPRVEAFGAGGMRVGWAHGDEHGQVLLLVDGIGALAPPTPSVFDVVLRTAVPDPAAAVDPEDPLADLVVEDLPRSQAPPTDQDLDNPVLRGLALPPGYRSSTRDVLRSLTVGRVLPATDLPHT
ncbi:hypothetical protein [Streptomyces sp. NRRL WC-3742]|uniref:hypothetical protein n=1 Tax=Streptomyces sp. NRRL WC-3742 TaxID=1463934 RepID=UPI00131ABF0E|nr:hypothetical protein [Streptomyces sp. NRRL WC-3742]